jgi:hemolysin III
MNLPTFRDARMTATRYVPCMATAIETVEEKREKPLLRGVFHEAAVSLALAGGIVLAKQATGPRATLAAAIYGASLTALFGISALYHRPRWGPRLYVLMRRLDHAAIFILIAGTYTPFCLRLMTRSSLLLLGVVWTAALAGVLFAVVKPRAPKWVNSVLYVALGWAVLPELPEFARTIPPGGIVLLAVGGVVYSVGALIYAMRRPDPYPRVFGYHEIFHLLVVAAAAFHYAAVSAVVGAM